MPSQSTVALVGLGAIGIEVAQRLDRGIPGLRLIAATDQDLNSARSRVTDFTNPPTIVGIEDLGVADIIVEAAGEPVLPAVVDLAIRHRRTVVACSVGGLLQQMELVDKASAQASDHRAERGARRPRCGASGIRGERVIGRYLYPQTTGWTSGAPLSSRTSSTWRPSPSPYAYSVGPHVRRPKAFQPI